MKRILQRTFQEKDSMTYNRKSKVVLAYWFAIFLFTSKWDTLSAGELSSRELQRLLREWNDCCKKRETICVLNKCYLVESRKSTWYSMRNRCRSRYSDWPDAVDAAQIMSEEEESAISSLLEKSKNRRWYYEDISSGAWTSGTRCKESNPQDGAYKYVWASSQTEFPPWLIERFDSDVTDDDNSDEDNCKYLTVGYDTKSPTKTLYKFQKKDRKYPAICQFVKPNDAITTVEITTATTEQTTSPLLATTKSLIATSTPHSLFYSSPTTMTTTVAPTTTKPTTTTKQPKIRTDDIPITVSKTTMATTESISLSTITTVSEFFGCKQRKVNGIEWPDTPPGQSVTKACPKGMIGLAEWTCNASTLQFHPPKPKVTHCHHEWLEELIKEIDEPSKDAVELSKRIANKTKQMLLSHGDLSALVNLTEKLIKLFVKQRKIESTHSAEPSYHFAKSMVASYSHVLRTEVTSAWADLNKGDQVREASRILKQIATTGHHLSCSVTTRNKLQHTVTEPNINLQTFRMDVKGEQKQPFIFPHNIPSEGNNTISLPGQFDFDHWHSSACNSGQKTAVGILYKNLEQFLQNRDMDEMSMDTVVVSPVISFSISNGTESKRLPHELSVSITLERYAEPEDMLLYGKPRCVFWNFQLGDFGDWDSAGCTTVRSNATHTVCSCNHLTNFAIIMDVNNVINVDDKVLEILTIVCCAISTISLVATCLALLGIRSLRCRRSTITCNLSFCLLLVNLLVLFGFKQTQFHTLCATIAGLLHFFILAAFCWMLLEGFHIYQMIVLVFSYSSHLPIIYFYSFGYGIPLIIVAISAAIEYEGYKRLDVCWISNDQGLMWSLIGPVALIIFINLIIFIMTMKSASSAKIKSEQNSIEKAKAWLKGSLSILCLLGLTWSVGFLYMIKDMYFTAYIFTVLNGLQGVFIFLFHVLLNDKAINAFLKIFHRKFKKNGLAKQRTDTRTTLTKEHLRKKSLSSCLTNASKLGDDVIPSAPPMDFTHDSDKSCATFPPNSSTSSFYSSVDLKTVVHCNGQCEKPFVKEL